MRGGPQRGELSPIITKAGAVLKKQKKKKKKKKKKQKKDLCKCGKDAGALR